MTDLTKKDIKAALDKIDKIITDLNVQIMHCAFSEIHHYESLINDLSALQGEYAVEVSA